MNIKISVIICTYNRRGLVPRAIESVITQEDVVLEVIVVDDCSVDGTYGYLKKRYGDMIKLASTKKNSGVSTATNEGYRHSSGKYIALLGDDDFWEDPRKIAKQLEIMEEHPHLGVTGTWWVELQEGGKRVEKKTVPPKSGYFLKEKMLMGGGVICGSTPLVSRKAWDTVGGMDEQQVKGTDSDLFRRIALAGYGVEVLHEVTTVVDVSHEMTRMTPVSYSKTLFRSIQGNLNVIRKNNVLFILYPRAFSFRIKRLIFTCMKFFIKKVKNRFVCRKS